MFLTLIAIVTGLYVNAQHFDQASENYLVYKLNLNQFKELSQKYFISRNSLFQNQPFAIIRLDSIDSYKEKMPEGNYVFVSAVKTKLLFQFFTRLKNTMEIGNYQSKPGLFIWDENGKIVSDADVHIRRKKLKFDPASGMYSLKNKKRGDISVIIREVFKEYELDKIEEDNDYDYRRRYHYGNYRCDITGFSLTSQPLYKPGDSLKCKAYLYNCFGEPLMSKVLVSIIDDNYNKIYKTTIDPIIPGTYVFDFLLSDTLIIDKKYTVNFSENDTTFDYHDLYSSCTFKLEDYLLDEATLKIEPLQETIQRSEPLQFKFTAADNNNLPLPDATVKIRILLGDVSNLNKPHTDIPETLFEKTYINNSSGELLASIPDSVFDYPADYEFKMHAELKSSSNELKEQNFDLSYIDRSREFYSEIVKDTLFIKNEKTYHGKIQVSYFNKDDFIKQEEFELPANIKLNPSYNNLIIESENQESEVDVKSIDPGIKLFSRVNKDSCHITLNNPYALDIKFKLLINGQRISGSFNSNQHWDLKLQEHTKAVLITEFLWAGQLKNNVYDFQLFDKKLKISTNLPEQIIPSDSSEIEVSITDYFDRPVQNVNLTVVSNSIRFSDANIPDLRYYGYKAKPSEYPEELELSQRSYGVKENNVDLNWIKKFGLENSIYYKCLLAGSDGFKYQFPLSQNDSGQAAIYPVQNNKFILPSIIYVDYNPVWYFRLEETPQSFSLRSGYHKIKLRFDKYSIWIDSLNILPNTKTIFAFNIDSLLPHGCTKIIEDDSKAYNLIRSVDNNFIAIEDSYQPEKSVLQSYSYRSIVNIERNKLKWFGPIKYSEKLSIIHSEIKYPANSFVPETGYYYTLKEGFVIAKAIPSYMKPKYLPPNPEWDIYPEERCQTAKEIDLFLENSDAKFLNKLQHYFMTDFPSEKGDLKVVNLQGGVKVSILLKLDTPVNSFPYLNLVSRFTNLDSGLYRLIYVYEGGDALSSQPFRIKNNVTTYILVDQVDTTFKTNFPGSDETYIFPGNNSSNYYNTGSLELKGKVIDESDKEPIPFASVSLSLTNTDMELITTVTDFDGDFNFRNVPPGIYDVVVASVGYTKKKITDVSIFRPNHGELKITLSKGISLQEVLVEEYKVPLITGGIPAAMGSYELIESSPTRDINSMVSQSAGVFQTHSEMNVRGSRNDGSDYYVDGIKIGNGKGAAKHRFRSDRLNLGIQEDSVDGIELLPMSLGIRSDFRDNAIWEPVLLTDSNGKAGFKVKWPGNLTQWRTSVLAINRRLQSGQNNFYTKSFKPLQASLAHPSFILEGDSLNFIGKIYNYTSHDMKLKASYSVNDTNIFERDTLCTAYALFDLPMSGHGGDSIKAVFSIQTEKGYKDGEEYKVPVYPRGMMEHNGFFSLIDHDTVLSFNGDENREVNFIAENSILNVMADDLEFLKYYVLECNEQMSSRLTALLIKKILINKTAAAKEEREIKRLIRLLSSNQNKSSGWGWWGKSETNLAMTNIVTDALLFAKENGFEVKCLDKKKIDFSELKNQVSNINDSINWLLLAAKLNSDFPYAAVLNSLNMKDSLSVYDKLNLLWVRQMLGDTIKNKELFDLKKENIYGQFYWGNDSYNLYDNSLMNSAIAYEISSKMGCGKDTMFRILGFIFSRRNGSHFESTLLSSRISKIIFNDYKKIADESENPKIVIESTNETISALPYRKKINIRGNENIIIKTNKPLFIGWYQDYFNVNPKADTTLYKIKSYWMQNGDTVKNLKTGAADFIIEMKVKKFGDYMMFEIPIPSGCTYARKNSNNKNSVHTEYFKNKTVIYYEHLPAGNYTISLPLHVRYNGECIINPAQIQNMYFPVISGNNNLTKVVLGGER